MSRLVRGPGDPPQVVFDTGNLSASIVGVLKIAAIGDVPMARRVIATLRELHGGSELLDALERAIGLDAGMDAVPDYYRLAVHLLTTGEHDQTALSLFKQVLTEKPFHLESLRCAAVIHTRLKQHLLAVPYLERTLELDPTSSVTKVMLADVLGTLGRLDGAKTLYLEVLAIDPENAELLGKLRALDKKRTEHALESSSQSMSSVRRLAVLLNFTANSYHWGCFGTSMEIYETLLDRGYYVEPFSVEETHLTRPTPHSLAQFNDPQFFDAFLAANPRHQRLLSVADVVVINGEGTLHGANNGPLNLLYLAFAAKRFLDKRVHLINTSFFPSGSLAPDATLDQLYGTVAKLLDQVVPREERSRQVLERLGISTKQGFDCLPRYLDRTGLRDQRGERSGLLLSGGITMDAYACSNLIELVKPVDAPLSFLTGAKGPSAREDESVYKRLAAAMDVRLIRASSMAAWSNAIGSSVLMISGRYHHTIAAATVGTPFIATSSNTPKIDATLGMMDQRPFDLGVKTGRESARQLIDSALAGKVPPSDQESTSLLVSLGAENFRDL